MMRRTVLGAVLALTIAGAAGADSFLDRGYGTPQFGAAPRSRELGGAGAALAGGTFGLIDNPATLALARGTRLQAVGSLSRLSENRFVPLFDTFDSFVDEAAIAINDHVYTAAEGGLVWDPKHRSGVMVAAGVFSRLDPRYDYADERRSTATTDQIVSERFIRTRGRLGSFAAGAAVPLPRGVSVGASVHRWFGTIEDRDALVPHATTVSARVDERERRLSGWSGTLGAAWRANERLDVGAAVETRVRLTQDLTVRRDDVDVTPAGVSDELLLPYRLHAGIAYRPRNTFRTTFVADAIWMPWSDVHDPADSDARLLDTWDVRFGLEHIYYNTLPGRIGFRYQRSYVMREADRAAITWGLGFRAARARLDVGGEVAKRISRQEPLWARTEQGGAVGAGLDRVEDTTLGLHAGVQWEY